MGLTMPTKLMQRILELGCAMISEEQLEIGWFRLTVDDVFVEPVRQLVWEFAPVTFRVDVVGASGNTRQSNHVRDAVRANQ